MLHFCKNLIYYMVVEVLEPNFHKLKEKLTNGSVKTIDDVMKAHNDFLDQCLKECLLTDQSLFPILTKINNSNNFFARLIQRAFAQIATTETHEKALADDEHYGKHSTLFKGWDDEEQKGSDSIDPMTLKRRQERIQRKADTFANSLRENSQAQLV